MMTLPRFRVTPAAYAGAVLGISYLVGEIHTVNGNRTSLGVLAIVWVLFAATRIKDIGGPLVLGPAYVVLTLFICAAAYYFLGPGLTIVRLVGLLLQLPLVLIPRDWAKRRK
jgi:hypothetical protein